MPALGSQHQCAGTRKISSLQRRAFAMQKLHNFYKSASCCAHQR